MHRLRSGLMLGRHAVAYGHARILPTGLLLLLEVLVVGHLLLLIGHVARVHAGGMWHVWLLGIDVVFHILGGLCWDVGSVDAVLTRGGIRCI